MRAEQREFLHWFITNGNYRAAAHNKTWLDVDKTKIGLVQGNNQPFILYNGVALYFMGM